MDYHAYARRHRSGARSGLIFAFSMILLLVAVFALVLLLPGNSHDRPLDGQRPAVAGPSPQASSSPLAGQSDGEPAFWPDGEGIFGETAGDGSGGAEARGAAAAPESATAAPTAGPPAAETGAPTRAAAQRPTSTVGAPASSRGAEAPAGGTEHYAVHVSSFYQTERAEAEARRLQRVGLPAFIRWETVNGRPTQRVYAGPYMDAEAARSVARRIKEDGLSEYSMVVRLAHDSL